MGGGVTWTLTRGRRSSATSGIASRAAVITGKNASAGAFAKTPPVGEYIKVIFCCFLTSCSAARGLFQPPHTAEVPPSPPHPRSRRFATQQGRQKWVSGVSFAAAMYSGRRGGLGLFTCPQPGVARPCMHRRICRVGMGGVGEGGGGWTGLCAPPAKGKIQ